MEDGDQEIRLSGEQGIRRTGKGGQKTGIGESGSRGFN